MEKIENRNVADTSLNPRDISPVQVRGLRKLLLRQSLAQPPPPYGLA